MPLEKFQDFRQRHPSREDNFIFRSLVSPNEWDEIRHRLRISPLIDCAKLPVKVAVVEMLKARLAAVATILAFCTSVGFLFLNEKQYKVLSTRMAHSQSRLPYVAFFVLALVRRR